MTCRFIYLNTYFMCMYYLIDYICFAAQTRLCAFGQIKELNDTLSQELNPIITKKSH